MNITQSIRTKDNLGSFITSCFFLIAGVVTLYDTTSYSDIDSKVFPQAVAIGLIIFSSISIISSLTRPQTEGGFEQGIWWRRILLVTTMLAACLVAPFVGFLPAGAIAFAGGLIAGMHDKWSLKTLFIYWGSGILIMVQFFVLFRYVLLVPLP